MLIILLDNIFAFLDYKKTNEIGNFLKENSTVNISVFEKSEHIITVVCLLEHVMLETEHDVYRKEILRCCNILSRLGDSNV